MGVLNKVRKLLGLAEEHEDKVAKQVSKKTSMNEEQVKEGLNKAQEAVNENSDGESGQNQS